MQRDASSPAPSTVGIIGCGDFLRWQRPALLGCPGLRVAAVTDPDRARAEAAARALDATAVESADAIFADPAIGSVLLFVPPWIRRRLFEQALAAGKHVLMTKPLAPNIADAEAMCAAAAASDRCCGVIYQRSDNARVITLRRLLQPDRYGRLALYRQDWIHAYPQWNSWATDPERNGGPFMDAMIHNLNIANHLMDRPVESAIFSGARLSHPELACADTESMALRYAGGGMAQLFITWAADLAVHATTGNDREHIDHCYLITDQGWMITPTRSDAGPALRCTRHGEVVIELADPAPNHYSLFLDAAARGLPLPETLITIEEAAADIRLIRQTAAQQDRAVAFGALVP